MKYMINVSDFWINDSDVSVLIFIKKLTLEGVKVNLFNEENIGLVINFESDSEAVEELVFDELGSGMADCIL